MSDNKHIHTVINPSEEEKAKFFEDAITEVTDLNDCTSPGVYKFDPDSVPGPKPLWTGWIQPQGMNVDTLSQYLEEQAKMSHPRFEKVPYEQFEKDVKELIRRKNDTDKESEAEILLTDKAIKKAYDNITLPQRSTAGSAGYDFVCPFTIGLYPKSNIMIPTGIRCYMPTNMVLLIYPRSGLSNKNRVFIVNTTPVIDSDYYNAENYGHIFIKLCYDHITNPYKDSPISHVTGYYIMNPTDGTLRGEGMVERVAGYDINSNGVTINQDLRVSWIRDNILRINAGDRIVQGIFTQYVTTYDDYIAHITGNDDHAERTGGHGSTGE